MRPRAVASCARLIAASTRPTAPIPRATMRTPPAAKIRRLMTNSRSDPPPTRKARTVAVRSTLSGSGPRTGARLNACQMVRSTGDNRSTSAGGSGTIWSPIAPATTASETCSLDDGVEGDHGRYAATSTRPMIAGITRAAGEDPANRNVVQASRATSVRAPHSGRGALRPALALSHGALVLGGGGACGVDLVV